MSKGLSRQQCEILWYIARHEEHRGKVRAWRDIHVSYGNIDDDYGNDSASTRRQDWNNEQSLRRALKSLKRRGLIGVDQYVFMVLPVGFDVAHICMNPENHIAGQTRIMTGAYLTDAGRAILDAATAIAKQEIGELPPDLREIISAAEAA
jgi:hypothetical protein